MSTLKAGNSLREKVEADLSSDEIEGFSFSPEARSRIVDTIVTSTEHAIDTGEADKRIAQARTSISEDKTEKSPV